MGRKLTTEEFITKAKAVHGDRYGYDRVVYVNNHTKVIIDCPEHGEFRQTPGNHLSGQGCRTCGGREPLTTKILIEKAKKVHGNTYGYDEVEYVNSKTKVTIRCSEHGVFLQAPSKHLSGQGCCDCGNKRIAKARSSNRIIFIIDIFGFYIKC